jgi:hypothetical protein
MSPGVLGVLLAITNVTANAILYGAIEDARGAENVFAYGIVPGMIAGAIIGAFAGATKHCARWLRALVIAVPAAAAVALLGAAFGVTQFVPCALIPTLMLCALLEWRTHVPANAAPAPEPFAELAQPRRSGVQLAMLLGAAVMLVVIAGGARNIAWAELYLPWGAGCGIALAVPFGVLADCTHERPVWMRRALLLTAGIGLTALLGVIERVPDLIAPASIPVAAGCLLLERYSRRWAVVPAAFARA